jgi:hypothetical protein
MAKLNTYSFLDTHLALVGPGIAISLGAGSGSAEEGITVEPADDVGSMTIGADGAGMHSLFGNKSARVTIRLLKTSPLNAQLAAALAFQRISSANYGQNTISLVNTVSGDAITCAQCGFARVPDITYAKEGGMNEWVFNCVEYDLGLGAGV